MVNQYSTGRSPTVLISVMVENHPVSYLRVNQSLLSKLLPLQPLAESREQVCSVLLEGPDISPHSHALTGALRSSYLSEGTGVSCVHSTHKVQGPATHGLPSPLTLELPPAPPQGKAQGSPVLQRLPTLHSQDQAARKSGPFYIPTPSFSSALGHRPREAPSSSPLLLVLLLCY